MENIGILHLSDFHTSQESITKLSRLNKIFIDDAKTVSAEKKAKIEILCITGDMINDGSKGSVEYDLFFENILLPIIEELHIPEERVFIVPGNHEVDTKKINEFTESGMISTLIDKEKINGFMKNLENENIKRITEFNEFNKLFKKEKEIVINQLASCYITKVGSLEIGLACINSAWRSSGRGGIEKGLMIIGENQVRECANALDECDIKICMFHHPTSWLADCEQLNVEKQLNGFDMVLNGHIHELDSKHITDFIGETLYNVTGKFDNSCDYYNGYSFLAINPNSYNCNIVARHFQDKRNCYEKAAHLNSTGEFSIDLKSKDKDKQNAYLIVNSINTPFMEYANSYLVTNVVEGYNKNTFDQLFIEPKFKLLTEYKKELTVEHDSVENVELETGIDEQCDKEIKLKELFLDDNNYFINGKKEIGKTTLLHYFVKHFCENFKTFGKVPIIIECLGQKFRGNTPIEKLIQTFIMNYADNDFKINMNDIICLLNKGLVIVLFDNFDSLKKDSDEKSIKSINEFLSNYPNCRYFFTEDETIRNFDYEDELYIACQYKKIYMQSMSKNQIRSLTERLIGISDSEKCTPIVDKLLTCFQNTNLPKTPFVTSLILSVCKENKTFEPVNEAIIMDNFMEILLEKISAGDAIRSQYDYNLKIDFLQYLVMEMKKNNRFYFSCLEFNQITLDYHKYHGFDLRSSQFNTLFFKKNILLQDDEKIKFRYSCMIEYLIAKKAKDNTDFLDEIMCEDRYLDYYNELVFYTGLVKNGKGILAYIENIFENLLNNYESILDELTDYNIMFQHTITKEKLETELLAEKRLTIEERDEITDKNDNSSQDDSINKKRVEGDIEKKEDEKFLVTMLLYGQILKNCETLSKNQKERILKNYLKGLSICLAKLKMNLESYYKNKIDSCADDEKEAQERKFSRIASDVFKISFPLVLENMALENIGTEKLKIILSEAFENRQDFSDFENLVITFLCADLGLKDGLKYIRKFANMTTTRSMLTITYFKLQFYYKFCYFPNSMDNELRSLILDVHSKVYKGKYSPSLCFKNSNNPKSKGMEKLKRQKREAQ